jgi:hypothetical protein
MQSTQHPAGRYQGLYASLAVSIRAALFLFVFQCAARAAGPVFTTALTGSGQEFASAVTTDAQGNTYVAGLTYSNDFHVTPGAYQTKFGQTCDAFVAKVSPRGRVLWATYLGGILDDWATGIALDHAGNVWVTGYTRSPDFPLVNPIQSTYNEGVTDDYDAFVAKFDPSGSKLLYSTFLGGNADDGAAGIAIDSADNIYIAVNSNSTIGYPGIVNGSSRFGIVLTKLTPQGAVAFNYVHPGGMATALALDSTANAYISGYLNSASISTATAAFGPPGPQTGFVFKISSDGSKKLFETAIGGSASTTPAAIALTQSGEIWIGGSTTSADFPLVHPLQSVTGFRPLWRSADAGITWMPLDHLPFALPQMMVVDPTNPTTLYEATGDQGIFKSLDGGANWKQSNSGIGGFNVGAMAIDPVNSQTLYAATASAVYKSADGAASWKSVDAAQSVSHILIDPLNPNIIYEASSQIRKSVDGGATWATLTFPGPLASMTLDPSASGHIVASTQFIFCGIFCSQNMSPVAYRSVDGGLSWTVIPSLPSPSLPFFADASTNPATLYNGLAYRSADGGVTWTSIPPSVVTTNPGALSLDPAGTFYAALYNSPMYVSHDHAGSWMAIGTPVPPWTGGGNGPGVNGLVTAGATGTLYASISVTNSAGFLAKLSSDGSKLEYSTYLSGHLSLAPYFSFASEPAAMLNQNWVSGLALDAAGNLVVTGVTRSADFQTAAAAQPANAGKADAFAAILSADGGTLSFSTFLGGSVDDGGLAAAVDPEGNLVIAGQTWSPDFPVPGGIQPPFGFGDAFVAKIRPPGLEMRPRPHAPGLGR